MKYLSIVFLSLFLLASCGGDSSDDPSPLGASGVLERTDTAGLEGYFQAVATRSEGARAGEQVSDGVSGGNAIGAPVASDGGEEGGFSGTNLQEAGVDEADLIKTDGRYIYSIDKAEGAFGFGAASSPPNGKFSTSHSIRIMDTQGGLEPVKRLESASGDWNLSGLYLTNNATQLVALSSPANDYWGNWFYPSYFANQETGVMFIDVGDPASASIKNQLHFDGALVASRRVGDVLYLALRHFPQIYAEGSEGKGEATPSSPTEAQPVEDYLPQYSFNDTTRSPAVVPENCYLEKGAEGSADIITLVAVDLVAETPTFESQCYVGSVEALYASSEALYLATTRYDYSWSNATAVYSDSITTDIHKFAFAAGSFDYRGSAEVRGHLGWRQNRKSFRFSEKDGFLRVLTFVENRELIGQPVTDGVQVPVAAPTPVVTRSSHAAAHSPVLLTILKEDPNKAALMEVSHLPNKARPEPIGLPHEELYASRFIGDRAYLVTFRLIDPFYVLDLSDPSDPFIAGELKIDGYSDYLHPITDTLLLGVGKDAIVDVGQGGDGRGAWYQGVKLSLFDVSDPANPREADKLVIGERGTEATVLSHHHGITGMRHGDTYRVALPISLHDRLTSTDEAREPWMHHDYTHTGLYRFEIDVVNGTLSKMAPLVATDYTEQVYGGYVGNDRSVFMGDEVHYLHKGNFWSQDWAGQGEIVGPK